MLTNSSLRIMPRSQKVDLRSVNLNHLQKKVTTMSTMMTKTKTTMRHSETITLTEMNHKGKTWLPRARTIICSSRVQQIRIISQPTELTTSWETLKKELILSSPTIRSRTNKRRAIRLTSVRTIPFQYKGTMLVNLLQVLIIIWRRGDRKLWSLRTQSTRSLKRCNMVKHL